MSQPTDFTCAVEECERYKRSYGRRPYCPRHGDTMEAPSERAERKQAERDR
jgi:hypothetical protein